MKNKVLSFMLFLLFCITADAQTYKYRLLKWVDRETGEEMAGDMSVKHITFYSGNNTFMFTDNSGKPNDYWSYMNNAPVRGGTGISTGKVNPRVFSYQNQSNGVLVYINNRTVCNNTTGQCVGHITDYINFSSDYQRFNIVSGGTAIENGFPWDCSSLNLDTRKYIRVYERVESGNSGTFY